MSEEIIEVQSDSGLLDLTEVRRTVKKTRKDDDGISTILGDK